MKIKKGDLVEVITGNDKGKRGEVLRVLPKENQVVVQGQNVRIKHRKERQSSTGRAIPGGRIEFEAPIHVSNVLVVCPKTNKPTRVGYQIVGDKKVRIAKVSGQELS